VLEQCLLNADEALKNDWRHGGITWENEKFGPGLPCRFGAG
jgi:hypothetical protein